LTIYNGIPYDIADNLSGARAIYHFAFKELDSRARRYDGSAQRTASQGDT
jgi:hypothetical protein